MAFMAIAAVLWEAVTADIKSNVQAILAYAGEMISTVFGTLLPSVAKWFFTDLLPELARYSFDVLINLVAKSILSGFQIAVFTPMVAVMEGIVGAVNAINKMVSIVTLGRIKAPEIEIDFDSLRDKMKSLVDSMPIAADSTGLSESFGRLGKVIDGIEWPEMTLPGWEETKEAFSKIPAMWGAAQDAISSYKDAVTDGIEPMVSLSDAVTVAVGNIAAMSSAALELVAKLKSVGSASGTKDSGTKTKASTTYEAKPRTKSEQSMFDALVGGYIGFATGVDRVPETALYLLHKDERVVSAAENRFILSNLSKFNKNQNETDKGETRNYYSKPVNITNVFNITSGMETLLTQVKSAGEDALNQTELRGYL
jgi:hypothetical protein